MQILHHLNFIFKKIIYKDSYLKSLSITEADLIQMLEGKSVALVGNSRQLGKQAYGADIDTHHIVIRLNDAPTVSKISHGAKTDWLALAKRSSTRILAEKQPAVLLWMPRKRNKLSWPMVNFSKFFLNNIERNKRLRETLKAPPSVGCLVVDLLRTSKASKISIFGFDFFKSRSLSGTRGITQVPHDFKAESRLLKSLLAEDQRFKLYE